MGDTASPSTTPPSNGQLASQYLVWVDGAGVFLLCLENQITIGGLRDDPHRANLCLMANLSRKHATLTRSHGGYQLQSHGNLTLDGKELTPEKSVPLKPPTTWQMNGNVEIQIQQPTVLSLTAVLDFQGSHPPLVGQPPVTIDRVILMDQNCLIGPGGGQHIKLGDCQEGIILYRSKGRLWCKSKTPFAPNDSERTNSHPLTSGDVIAGDDFRFRIEAVPTTNRS